MINKNIKFVHLHVHTQYSLLDGAIRLEDLFRKIKSQGMDSVAITDHGTMFGVLDFHKRGVEAGIKPIIGCECYITSTSITQKNPQDRKKTNHIVLLAENRRGYENLCKLSTIAQFEGFYYKPRIDKHILAKYHEGLICLSGCLKGEIAQYISLGLFNEAEQAALDYLDILGENNFFLEVQNNGIDVQDRINEGLYDLSQKLSIPLVATNDCHYLERADAKAHEILLCIKTHKTINDPDRFTFDSKQLYVKSPQEMSDQFSDFPNAIDNTVKIAERCNVDFEFGTYHFPKYGNKSNENTNDIFDRKVQEGYSKRLRTIKTIEKIQLDQKIYDERLQYEMGIIKTMGFSGYFLIVSDFIEYAKKSGISVGPGRGSASGSLVSYALSITDIDPIRHGLIFERFLNPSRISMPDIDVDFCVNGRERVHEYLIREYGGSEYVAQIITFGTMKARMVVRDVGRALGILSEEVDFIAKLIPEGTGVTITSALCKEPKLKKKIQSNLKFSQLIEISKALEGLLRHASTHAAGIVISDKPLVNYMPLYKGKRGETVTQFDMKKVEDIGLIKFDLLGLKNLTVIDNTLKIILKQKRTVPDLSLLGLKDLKTYELLQRGDTTGVFQLESVGMKNLLTSLKPQNFDEITALIALYRPGPLDSGMVTEFVERKHDRKKVEYIIPSLEPILRETYGIMVYQEQVMQVAVELAGYSMADADSLRKAISKKIKSLMAEHRQKFTEGVFKKGISYNKANELFDLIEKFGGYGFNKSHSAAYAIITYRTAYLKAHYPVEFMAALLTSEIDNIEGIVKFIRECKLNKINILPPDINESNKNFTVDGGNIKIGLAAIKNVGTTAVDSIIKERQNNGVFSSVYNFFRRIDFSKVNKRVIEGLVCCGTLDTIKYQGKQIDRFQLKDNLENLINYGQNEQKRKNSKQVYLPFNQKTNINEPPIPSITTWDHKGKLLNEKKYLGFYISGHPVESFKNTLEKFANLKTVLLKEQRNNLSVRFGGIIDEIKEFRTKKGTLAAFITLDNMYERIEVVVFSDIYSKYNRFLSKDEIIFIQGNIKSIRGDIKIVAEIISDLNNLDNTWKVDIHFIVNSEYSNATTLLKLRKTLLKYPGMCNGFIHIKIENVGKAIISIKNSMKIKFCEKMIIQISTLLGCDAIKTKLVLLKSF